MFVFGKPDIASIVEPLNTIIAKLEAAQEWFGAEEAKQIDIASVATQAARDAREQLSKAEKVAERIKALVA